LTIVSEPVIRITVFDPSLGAAEPSLGADPVAPDEGVEDVLLGEQAAQTVNKQIERRRNRRVTMSCSFAIGVR
jgi:hypothetical protein